MKTHLRIAIGLAIASLMAGCGSSGESTSGMTPPASADAFTQSVQAVAATSSDTAVPIAIDGIAAVGPDTALPVGL
jgi:uncharacterized lipoprotein YbaY